MNYKVLLFALSIQLFFILCTNGASSSPNRLTGPGQEIERKLNESNLESEAKKAEREKFLLKLARNNKNDIVKTQDKIKVLEKKFGKHSTMRKIFMPKMHRKLATDIDHHKSEKEKHLNSLRGILSDVDTHTRQGNLPLRGHVRITDASGVDHLPG